jgi:hypothetical protein
MHFQQALVLRPFHDAVLQGTFQKFWQNGENIYTHGAKIEEALILVFQSVTGNRNLINPVRKRGTDKWNTQFKSPKN